MAGSIGSIRSMRRGQVGEEDARLVVELVERQPRDVSRLLRRPVGEQHGLAVSGRRDDRRRSDGRGSARSSPVSRARETVDGVRHGQVELGLHQRERWLEARTGRSARHGPGSVLRSRVASPLCCRRGALLVGWMSLAGTYTIAPGHRAAGRRRRRRCRRSAIGGARSPRARRRRRSRRRGRSAAPPTPPAASRPTRRPRRARPGGRRAWLPPASPPRRPVVRRLRGVDGHEHRDADQRLGPLVEPEHRRAPRRGRRPPRAAPGRRSPVGGTPLPRTSWSCTSWSSMPQAGPATVSLRTFVGTPHRPPRAMRRRIAGASLAALGEARPRDAVAAASDPARRSRDDGEGRRAHALARGAA